MAVFLPDRQTQLTALCELYAATSLTAEDLFTVRSAV